MLFAPKEKGQGLVEYALILVLVAIVVIAALMILGPIIGNVTSPLFGQANQPAGSGTAIFSESANNRRLELQMRFTF